ncbi:hypothetical protein ACQ4M3_04010 [Leptolyngbya sp. AN03gr2]|uniref:hypothetical protein n=1 Tax=unclassified Leptolyngbya TaxID=2650499 RepID=UPI003D310DF2
MMTSPRSTWTPTSTVTGHTGESLPSNLVFFVPPPPEIGQIRSAYSTLETGKSPMQIDWYYIQNTLFSGLCFAFLAGLFTWLPIALLLPRSMREQSSTYATIAALIVSGIVLWLMLRGGFKLPVECSYVGEQGVALYFWNTKRSGNQNSVLVFRQASELRTGGLRQYYGNTYMHTLFWFKWTNEQNQPVFEMSGVHQTKEGNPPLKNRYHFAIAAEAAWSLFALERAKATLAHGGAVRFPLLGTNALTVGNGFLEIVQQEMTERVTTSEIDRLSISQGVVTLRLKDAKSGFFGLGSSGIYRFDYTDIANAKLFLLLFGALVGVES